MGNGNSERRPNIGQGALFVAPIENFISLLHLFVCKYISVCVCLCVCSPFTGVDEARRG